MLNKPLPTLFAQDQTNDPSAFLKLVLIYFLVHCVYPAVKSAVAAFVVGISWIAVGIFQLVNFLLHPYVILTILLGILSFLAVVTSCIAFENSPNVRKYLVIRSVHVAQLLMESLRCKARSTSLSCLAVIKRPGAIDKHGIALFFLDVLLCALLLSSSIDLSSTDLEEFEKRIRRHIATARNSAQHSQRQEDGLTLHLSHLFEWLIDGTLAWFFAIVSLSGTGDSRVSLGRIIDSSGSDSVAQGIASTSGGLDLHDLSSTVILDSFSAEQVCQPSSRLLGQSCAHAVHHGKPADAVISAPRGGVCESYISCAELTLINEHGEEKRALDFVTAKDPNPAPFAQHLQASMSEIIVLKDVPVSHNGGPETKNTSIAELGDNPDSSSPSENDATKDEPGTENLVEKEQENCEEHPPMEGGSATVCSEENGLGDAPCADRPDPTNDGPGSEEEAAVEEVPVEADQEDEILREGSDATAERQDTLGGADEEVVDGAQQDEAIAENDEYVEQETQEEYEEVAEEEVEEEQDNTDYEWLYEDDPVEPERDDIPTLTLTLSETDPDFGDSWMPLVLDPRCPEFGGLHNDEVDEDFCENLLHPYWFPANYQPPPAEGSEEEEEEEEEAEDDPEYAWLEVDNDLSIGHEGIPTLTLTPSESQDDGEEWVPLVQDPRQPEFGTYYRHDSTASDDSESFRSDHLHASHDGNSPPNHRATMAIESEEDGRQQTGDGAAPGQVQDQPAASVEVAEDEKLLEPVTMTFEDWLKSVS